MFNLWGYDYPQIPQENWFQPTFSRGVSSPMNSAKDSLPSKSRSMLAKNSSTSALHGQPSNISLNYHVAKYPPLSAVSPALWTIFISICKTNGLIAKYLSHLQEMYVILQDMIFSITKHQIFIYFGWSHFGFEHSCTCVLHPWVQVLLDACQTTLTWCTSQIMRAIFSSLKMSINEQECFLS